MLATINNLARLDDHDLTTSISTANRAFTSHKANFILAVAEFDERGLARPLGANNTAAWLVRTQGLSQRTAYEYVGVGKKMRPFPLLSEAFASGDLSYSKVRLLLRYMTTDNEAGLVQLALAHTITELEELLAGREQVGGRKRKAANRVSVTVCPETGRVKFWGTLDAERGAEMLAALKAAELSGADSPEKPAPVAEPPPGTDPAPDAGPAPDPKPAPDSSTTRHGSPIATSLISAFFTMFHIVRAHRSPAQLAPGAQVNVIIDADDNARIPGQPGASTPELLRSILNGFLSLQIHGARGRILHLGRSSRLINRAQEKALLTRWNYRCAVPGCDHTRWIQFHHILAWASGGTTDLDNLIPLCTLHHTMISNEELVIVPDDVDPSLLRFRFAGGETYTSVDNQPPMLDIALGQHTDRYTHGPVPRGDEHLLDIWEHEDTFDDVDGTDA